MTETTQGNFTIVEAECSFAADRSAGVIVVESSNEDFPRAIEELASAEARQMAIGYAVTRGVADARQNGNVVGPYAINSEGTPLDKVPVGPDGQPLPHGHPLKQVAGYRVEVPVCRRLV